MGQRSSNLVDVAVGVRIRHLRLRSKMSQEELGNHLKVSFQQVQKYEKGTNRVGASRLAQLAKIFGVSVAVFFNEDHNDKTNKKIIKEFPILTDAYAIRMMEAYQALADRNLQSAILHLTEEMVRSQQD